MSNLGIAFSFSPFELMNTGLSSTSGNRVGRLQHGSWSRERYAAARIISIVKSTGMAVKERLAFRQTSPVKWLAITAFILNYMGQVPGKRGAFDRSMQHHLM